MSSGNLPRRIEEIGSDAGVEAIAVAFYDYRHHTGWSYHGDAWFHAASTIKVPVMVAVFDQIRKGRFGLDSRLHVRNRFLSAAGDAPFRVGTERDANAAVHDHLGRTMRIRELLHHMITTSSNLATNLLVDLVTPKAVNDTLREMGIEGIDFHRGVEDERAWEVGINNQVTADGLVAILRRIAERRAVSREASETMLEILHGQEFRRGIPAGLPDDARVAHKTGEISTVAHDAGIIFLPDRDPYVLAVLTQWDEGSGSRQQTIARVSRAVYEYVEGNGPENGDG